MKKIILTIAFIASGMVASAQVGIGNEDPKVTLQVDASGTDADGVLVPRVSVDALNAKDAKYVAAQNGALVFVNDLTGTAAGKTSNVSSTGFYYYNSVTSKWTAVGGAAVAPQRYEAIRGNVSTFSTSTYTVQANDYIVISTYAGGVPSVTFPPLTNTAADIGRLVFYFNNQVASGTTFNGITFAGTATNQQRGRTFVWSGTQWIGIGL